MNTTLGFSLSDIIVIFFEKSSTDYNMIIKYKGGTVLTLNLEDWGAFVDVCMYVVKRKPDLFLKGCNDFMEKVKAEHPEFYNGNCQKDDLEQQLIDLGYHKDDTGIVYYKDHTTVFITDHPNCVEHTTRIIYNYDDFLTLIKNGEL